MALKMSMLLLKYLILVWLDLSKESLLQQLAELPAMWLLRYYGVRVMERKLIIGVLE
jgi:hypothetical protein